MGEQGEIIIYQTEGGLTKIDVTMQDETVWLSQADMSTLFQTTKQNISLHINNIFKDGELDRASVVKEYLTTGADGKNYKTKFYNLDVIISVGYRVKSQRGVQFRIWATNILKEYMKKGFAMDDDRLKELGGGGYFKELLERIRDIRASEKVFYRQVLEIYATSIDYNPNAAVSIQFFKRVQNKIHYAVSGYLDFAERQAEREIPMTMEDWAKHLDGILTSTGENLLIGNGTISHNQAMDKAQTEYKNTKQKH